MKSIIRRLAAAGILALGANNVVAQPSGQTLLDANVVKEIEDRCNSQYAAYSPAQLRNVRKRQRMGGSNNPEEIRKKLIELCKINEYRRAVSRAEEAAKEPSNPQ